MLNFNQESNRMKKVCFVLLFALVSQLSFAAHIISGSMHYTCLGGQEFEFTMILFRDCSGGGANFDDPAPFALYRNNVLEASFSIAPGAVETIPPASFEDCDTNFPNYCLQRTTYTFTSTLSDPNSTYTAVYQRCCWSHAITNLEGPEAQGVTIKTDVTPAAIAACNSQSPIEFPLSIASCPGTEVSLPLPQFDTEGDSLVYGLCTPLAGGGIEGTAVGDPFGCEGVLPTPPCVGPYFPVVYAAGFTAEDPIPTESGIHLDPVTGTMTFTPTTIGRYIFGLCVTEYRDGQVLGYYEQPIESFGALSATPVEEDWAVAPWSISQWLAHDRMIVSRAAAAREARFQLVNISGEVVWARAAQAIHSMEVPLQQLSAGVYFLTINEEGKLQTLRFVLP